MAPNLLIYQLLFVALVLICLALYVIYAEYSRSWQTHHRCVSPHTLEVITICGILCLP